MSKEALRLRMFAGPNGSGKSTFKSIIRPELLGIFINPDEIERQIQDHDFLDLEGYQVKSTEKEILDFFINFPLLKAADLLDEAQNLRFNDGKLLEEEKAKIREQEASLHWQEQFKDIQKTLEQKTNQYMDSQMETKLLARQLADAQKSLSNALAQNKLPQDDKWSLAQEKAQLEGPSVPNKCRK